MLVILLIKLKIKILLMKELKKKNFFAGAGAGPVRELVIGHIPYAP
jgi:hypothetical protein